MTKDSLEEAIKRLEKTLEEAKELTIKKRKNLDVDEFAVPGQRKLPIHDCNHVRSAMGRFSQTKGLSDSEKRSAVKKILKAAKRCGIDSSGFRESHKDLLS